MTTPQEHISFDLEAWKIKITDRKRGRMKFQLKLNKEETEGFLEFTKNLKPEQMTDEEWVRSIFYKGLEKIQGDIMDGMKKYMEEHKEDIDASALEAMGDVSAVPEIIDDED